MKKLLLSFVSILIACLAFQACDDTMTYAERLEREDDAIADFINKHNIKVISQSEFYANDSVTNVEENEFVQLASGVYMQIVDKGSDNPADTVKNYDIILVRFMEYSLIDEDTTCSNLSYPQIVDEFRYTETESSIAGIFTTDPAGMFIATYGNSNTAVPAGWLVPLEYIRDRAHVRLIVPAEMGHMPAQQYVYPYYYDITKYQIWK